MTYNFKIKLILTIASLLCLWGLSVASLAAPAESGSCPAGHQHMGHGGNVNYQPDDALKKLADDECSSCHGTAGVSVSDNIPNLAGQDSLYMCGWLIGCRNQGDKCEGHEDLAAKFNDHEIVNLSEFYSHLPAVKW
jgi:cytochrome c553